MSARCLIAVDPGASGGLVCLPAAGPLSLYRMPDTQEGVLALLRQCMAGADEGTLYLEKVGGFVKGRERTGSAMFGFGQGYGFIQGVALAYHLDLRLVTPQCWMKALGLGTRDGRSDAEWKRHLKRRAQEMYPDERVTLATSDALLIFEFARRQVLGGSEWS